VFADVHHEWNEIKSGKSEEEWNGWRGEEENIKITSGNDDYGRIDAGALERLMELSSVVFLPSQRQRRQRGGEKLNKSRISLSSLCNKSN
jgi:hypothetical protein